MKKKLKEEIKKKLKGKKTKNTNKPKQGRKIKNEILISFILRNQKFNK